MASRCEPVQRAASASLRALRTIHLSQAGQDCPMWLKTVQAHTAESPRECNTRALSEVICNIAASGREVSVMKKREVKLCPGKPRVCQDCPVQSLLGQPCQSAALCKQQTKKGLGLYRDIPSTSHTGWSLSDTHIWQRRRRSLVVVPPQLKRCGRVFSAHCAKPRRHVLIYQKAALLCPGLRRGCWYIAGASCSPCSQRSLLPILFAQEMSPEVLCKLADASSPDAGKPSTN